MAAHDSMTVAAGLLKPTAAFLCADHPSAIFPIFERPTPCSSTKLECLISTLNASPRISHRIKSEYCTLFALRPLTLGSTRGDNYPDTGGTGLSSGGPSGR